MAKATRTVEKQQLVYKLAKKQLCTCSTLFFVNFFAVILHNYNVKLPETSWLHEMWYGFLFSFFPLSLIFTLVAADISHFLTAATKFHVVSPTKMTPLFFLSRSSSFSRWASPDCRLTFSLSLSFSLSIFQIVGHDN